MTAASPEYQRDLDMAKNPDNWPVWPLLPLIKRDGSHEAGRLFHPSIKDDNVQPVVYVGLIYFAITPETPTVKYDSLDDLFADGWRVD